MVLVSKGQRTEISSVVIWVLRLRYIPGHGPVRAGKEFVVQHKQSGLSGFLLPPDRSLAAKVLVRAISAIRHKTGRNGFLQLISPLNSGNLSVRLRQGNLGTDMTNQ